jgi:pilus assembly protein CpaF
MAERPSTPPVTTPAAKPGAKPARVSPFAVNAASGDGVVELYVGPEAAPDFLYSLIAPAWAERNQLVPTDFEYAAALASRMADSKVVEPREAFERLVDRGNRDPRRTARLKKLLADAVNGTPDDPAIPSIAAIVASEMTNRPAAEIELRPTDELIDRLYANAYGWGPVEPYLSDPTVTEIMVNESDTIIVERTIDRPTPDGRIEKVAVRTKEPVRFGSPDVYRRYVEKMAQTAKVPVNFENPTVDFTLPGGQRVNITIPPITREPSITIRVFKERLYSIDDLMRFGSLSGEMRRFIAEATKAGANMIAYGPTGSGKTTLIGALIAEKEPAARLVIIEDTREIAVDVSRHENVVRAITSDHRDLRSLVRNALRQAPEHLIVGETRDATAFDLVQSFITGQRGSLSTIHANGPENALRRLTNMLRQDPAAPTEEPARQMVSDAIHLLVWMDRVVDGTRRVVSIDEVRPLGPKGEFETVNIFRMDRVVDPRTGAVRFAFEPDPQYVMGPVIARLFRGADLDPNEWTGWAAREQGLRPEGE